jgi:hypothetical protein
MQKLKSKKQKIDVVGLDLEQQEAEDSFLAGLTNIAYSRALPSLPYKSRKSRFWFTLKTAADDVEVLKSKMQTKALEHIDSEVEARLGLYKEEVHPTLLANISKVREFFLTEIAPLTLASGVGALQGREVVQKLVDSPVDGALFSKFDQMVNRAATLKLSQFVATYFGLEDSDRLLGIEKEDNQILTLLKGIQNDLKSRKT